MLISFLIGCAIGAIISSVIDIIIDVIDKKLSSFNAKKLAEDKTGKKFSKLIVEKIQENAEIGQNIDIKAFDENNEHVANITYRAAKGTTLFTGQIIN